MEIQKMELPQLSMHRVEYYYWQDQIGRQTKTLCRLCVPPEPQPTPPNTQINTLHNWIYIHKPSLFCDISGEYNPTITLFYKHCLQSEKKKKEKIIIMLNMPKPFYVVWSKQLVSLINIFWFYKPNHSKLDTYSSHLLALPHRDIGLNSEFKLHKKKLTLFFLLRRTNSSPPHTTRSIPLIKQLLPYHVLQSDDVIPDLS